MLAPRLALYTRAHTCLPVLCSLQVVCKVSLEPEAGLSQPAGKSAAQQDVYYPGKGAFAQEPIFVPRPGGKVSSGGTTGARGALGTV